MREKIEIILQTIFLQMKSSFARSMFRFCLLISPIANTILVYYMFKNSGQKNFTSYVVLGAGLMGVWSCICFSSVGDINRERWNGTLSIIYTAPADFRLIIWGKIIGNTLLSLNTIIISLLTLLIIFRQHIQIYQFVYFIVALVAVILCFMILSVLIAYLLTLSRKTSLYMNCIDIPITLLCGFLFPVDMLPKWVQFISNLLAPTWAIKILRLSLQNSLQKEKFFHILIMLVVINICYIFIIHRLYRIIDDQIRRKATLEVS